MSQEASFTFEQQHPAAAEPAAVRPLRRPGVEAHEVLDEMILYDGVREMAFSLNVAARAVWELCSEGRTIHEISRELGRCLGIDGADLLKDVAAAVQQLRDLGLVTIFPEEA